MANKGVHSAKERGKERGDPKVARWQILIPSFSLDCARVEGVGDQILQRSIAEPWSRRAKRIRSKNLAIAIWQPCRGSAR